MKLGDLVSLQLLSKHLTGGFVSVQRHPTLPLRIFNYTHRAQYEPRWGDETIDYCRGLIVDERDEIIARPFKKFHNLNTESIPETMEANLPAGLPPSITEKLDGSLGIYYWYAGVEGIASRGSFTSVQATWATNWYRQRVKEFRGIDRHDRMEWPYYTTPLFEIIYPENRIVVKYDFEGLVLIGLVDNDLGYEWGGQRLQEVADHNQIPTVREYKRLPVADLKTHNRENEEGYVLTYFKQDAPPLKVKIKMADYVRLHRIVTGMNARSLWEIFKTPGYPGLSILDDAPTHVKAWAGSWYEKLHRQHSEIYTDACNVFNNRPIHHDWILPREYRRLCAMYFFNEVKERRTDEMLKSLFFAMLDERGTKKICEMIWDMLEPRGDDRSFQVTQGVDA